LVNNLIKVTVFLLVILAIELSNLIALKGMECTGNMHSNKPKVSVLVPAINEEHNIAAYVDSILK